MIVAGCDVGSLTSKAVVMRGDKILGSAILRSRTKPAESAEKVMAEALARAGVSKEEIVYSVGTGYGRAQIPFVDEVASEIACHAKGARWLLPSARTVIDIGGQDCKAIRIDPQGKVVKFLANDKCAAGTGRFLEVMARLLGISLDELGELSGRATAPIVLAPTCTVWAQADVVQQVSEGVSIENIAAGINNAMAGRVATLANGVQVEREVCMTGGVAKNRGVLLAFEKLIGTRVVAARRADPQLAGAIGAARAAGERAGAKEGGR